MAATPPLLALGFDYGERRIGVAAGDTLTGTARPVTTIQRPAAGTDWTAIERVIREWQPAVLVVGLPYNMDGSTSRLTELAREFASELRRRSALETITVDERLSSRAAADILREQRASGARKRRVRTGDVDPVAAALLLEQWFHAGAPRGLTEE
jgi:putative Holliday junction resolvase